MRGRSRSQRAELDSDPYATGQALFALSSAIGLAATDAAYQRGVSFLLSTQRADGSWYVRSRAVKFQPFFEGGFPYGHDQWISSMATGWATAALGARRVRPAGDAGRALVRLASCVSAPGGHAGPPLRVRCSRAMIAR